MLWKAKLKEIPEMTSLGYLQMTHIPESTQKMYPHSAIFTC